MRIKRLAAIVAIVAMTLAAMPAAAADFAKVLMGDEGYMGQRADNGRSKSGTGMQKLGKGGVYVGDFNRDKYNGRGMMIAGGGNISNAPDAFVYIGGWVQGKKSGRGTCYAANGDILYRGRFENDRPTEKYPQDNPDIDTYFSMIDTPDNGVYIGEVMQGAPEGFGITVQPDGSYWIGNTKDGERRGVSTFIYGPREWSVVNYKNGGYTEITSSDEYNARRNHFAQVKRAQMAELWTGLAECASGIMDVASQAAANKAQANGAAAVSSADGGGSYAGGSASGSSSRSHGSSASSSKKGNDCGTAWMSDSRVYSDYETQLIKGGQSLEDRDWIRSKMRSIRQKWTQRGCLITKSPQE